MASRRVENDQIMVRKCDKPVWRAKHRNIVHLSISIKIILSKVFHSFTCEWFIFCNQQVGDLRDIFQSLFGIVNSLQGVCIFILFTILDEDARSEWSRVLLTIIHWLRDTLFQVNLPTNVEVEIPLKQMESTYSG